MIKWLSGDGKYENLIHCMNHDWPWIGLRLALCLMIVGGYLWIMVDWWRHARQLEQGSEKKALGRMKWIFFWCGICGYAFPIISIKWPVYRLQVIALIILVTYTLLYCSQTLALKIVYKRLNQADIYEKGLREVQVMLTDDDLYHQEISEIIEAKFREAKGDKVSA